MADIFRCQTTSIGRKGEKTMKSILSLYNQDMQDEYIILHIRKNQIASKLFLSKKDINFMLRALIDKRRKEK